MDRRLLASILLILFFILGGTGIVMYFTPYSKNVVAVHTLMGLLTLIFILFHFVNNKRILGLYLTGKGLKFNKRLHPLLITTFVIMISLAAFYEMPGFSSLYAWGNEFRNSQVGKTDQIFDYQVIAVEDSLNDYSIAVEAKKGQAFRHPQFAVWLGDSTGAYLKTLYISNSISNSEYKNVYDGKNWKRGIVRRPEALPVWAHQRNIKASDGLYIPLGEAADLDGVSGATPNSNFILQTSADVDRLRSFMVFMEVNQSFDWNAYYSAERFPEDTIYSGSGKVGQPSMIYAGHINTDDLQDKKYFFLELKGHGHHSGKTGEIYTTMDSITTAAEIVDRVIVKIEAR